MADVIDYQIFGDDLQLVEVGLDQGEGVRAEAGTMTYMEDGIEMQTGLESKPDETVTILLEKLTTHVDNFTAELELVNKCAPFCP